MLLSCETRCGVDEIRYYGAVAISSSSTVRLFGQDPPDALPLRSTAKPFFLGALLETILRSEKFAVEELALMSSSHNGEPNHVATLIGLLRRYGLSPEHLQCGVHDKWRAESSSLPAGNNCSGKHAAFLIGALVAGCDVKDYLDPQLVTHRTIVEKITEAYGQSPSAVGVDGCSLPTYAFPLDTIARTYRAYAMDELGTGYSTVRKATLEVPFYVGGTDRLETYLIGHYGLCAKSGSDGLWALGVPSSNLGVAVKIWSGVEAVAQAVLLDILHNRGILDVGLDKYLNAYHRHTLHTLTGRMYGERRVCFHESCECLP